MIFVDARGPYNAMIKAVDDFSESNMKFAEVEGILVDEAQASAVRLIFIGVFCATVISLFLAWKITQMIVVPIKGVAEVAEKVAHGDLTAKITTSGSDEIGRLLVAISRMQESLVTLVGNVRNGSDMVAIASVEIAQGNHDLSTRTEGQASSLQETSASIEVLSSTVLQNAYTANEASELAGLVSMLAINGGKAVGQVVSVIKEINESSHKIADIVSIIDGIAFQTNILALNAAVEAARAGDHGKGFAVVAGEVRTLAGRSAEASKQIKGLINTSVAQVSLGVKLADDAGEQISHVVVSVNKVTELVNTISNASKEQSLNVAQVSEAVNHMDQVVQQNVALVEEMAAATGSLRDQANSLVAHVSVFKI
jgi:methyl-accepting chemotaxis protein